MDRLSICTIDVHLRKRALFSESQQRDLRGHGQTAVLELDVSQEDVWSHSLLQPGFKNLSAVQHDINTRIVLLSVLRGQQSSTTSRFSGKGSVHIKAKELPKENTTRICLFSVEEQLLDFYGREELDCIFPRSHP